MLFGRLGDYEICQAYASISSKASECRGHVEALIEVTNSNRR